MIAANQIASIDVKNVFTFNYFYKEYVFFIS